MAKKTKIELELENAKLKSENERLKAELEEYNTTSILTGLNNDLSNKKEDDAIKGIKELREMLLEIGLSNSEINQFIIEMLIEMAKKR